MGYESKVIIVERNEFTKNFRGEPLDKPIVNAITVAEYDLCKMGHDNQAFFNVFTSVPLPWASPFSPRRCSFYGCVCGRKCWKNNHVLCSER